MSSAVAAVILLVAVSVKFGSCSNDVKNCEYRDGVCVCNSTFCDEIAPMDANRLKHGIVYTSSKAGLRFKLSFLNSTKASKDHKYTGDKIVTIHVNSNITYQKLFGFGGAFTDAAGINIKALPEPAQERLLMAYFDHATQGIGYTMGRIPIASCDFSTREYSYADVPHDFNLSNFKLAEEDFTYKIPLIKMALNMSGGIRLFGSPWSAPAWMKTSKSMHGNGTLKGKPGGIYYRTWANYFLKFLQQYKVNGVPLWGITAQNEPLTGFIANYSFQTMGFTPETQRDFISFDLGPLLYRNGYSDLLIMVLDGQRPNVPEWTDKLYSGNSSAKNYVSGTAVHWYMDAVTPPAALDYAAEHYPDKFLLMTEACAGEGYDPPWQKRGPVLGLWDRAERYAADIIQNLNHWATGFVDWNLALDLQGGPNWVKNFVDSPVIVNASAGEFYKQPIFYALGHFSKFLLPDSVWLKAAENSDADGLHYTLFLRPDGAKGMVLLNKLDVVRHIEILDASEAAPPLRFTLPELSISTLLWK